LLRGVDSEVKVFDIFRLKKDRTHWVDAAPAFEDASRLVQEIGAGYPGEYVILDSRSGRKTTICVPAQEEPVYTPGVTAAAELILAGAMGLCGADFGSLQVADPGTNALNIVAQENFGWKFLRRFQTVRSGETGTACGLALQDAKRIIVKDVARDELVYSKDVREAILGLGIQSAQSVPLIANSRVVGVLSTLHCKSHTPNEVHLRISDSLAARFARQLAEAFPAYHPSW
jgi:GAF domain-containing protein